MPEQLFGREEELRDIGAAFDAISAHGSALAVIGDPGVGKTALLGAAACEADRRGLLVLSVRGAREEAHLRFAALHRLLGPVLDRADGLPPRHRAALFSAFGLADDQATPDRFFVALAALELIADVGANTPVVLLVDDLHWVDSASRDAIGFIARRIETEPAVLLLAARPVAENLVADESSLAMLKLKGLDPAAARELLEAHSPWLSPIDARRVLDGAAGNPLALLEMSLALGRAGAETSRSTTAPLPLTTRLELSFAARAHELDPAARTVLLVAALQDSDLLAETFAVAGELTGDGDPGMPPSAAIDEAAAAGLLSISGDSFRFRHPLVRSAIAQAASPARRAEVHEAFARALRADSDRATWHRALAASQPDEGLAEALDDGADRAVAHGAPDLAEQWLERAAELSVDERRRGHRLLRAAELAFELGRAELVNELMARARDLPLDPPDYAWLAGLEGAFDDGVPGDEANVLRLVASADRARDSGERELAAYLLLGAAMPCYWGAAEEPLRGPVRAATRVLGLPAADPRNRASQKLAESGQQAEPQARYAWARLSPQELQVAQLAAQGLSNRDIGARLYLSHRTVGSHLNRVYPKLGVHTRTELRAVLSDDVPASRGDG
jgi:DNA-binding CsgD family transcriptional regulator